MAPPPLPRHARHSFQGSYELLHVIHRRPDLTVWEARHRAADRLVAIKVPNKRGGQAPTAASARLRREAEVAMLLTHPTVPRVHCFGESNLGDAFVVAERVRGTRLDSVPGRWRPTRAVATLLPLVDALQQAHSLGVLLNDLRPETIALETDGERLTPRLTDLGRCHIEGQGESIPVGRLSPHAAPELLNGSRPSAASDVHGVASMLVLMLSGAVPFPGRPLPTDIALELSAILRSALRLDPQKRATAGQFGTELARWLRRQGIERDGRRVRLEEAWPGSEPQPPRSELPSVPTTHESGARPAVSPATHATLPETPAAKPRGWPLSLFAALPLGA